MDKYVEDFCRARQYLFETLESKVEVFMTGFWDPFCKHTIIKETSKIIDRELEQMFPDLPKKYYPKIRFRIFDDEFEIEVGIQNYLNKEKDLIYLGTNEVGATPFDYYMRESWDPQFDYLFIARYGHENQSKFTGSKTAKAEYYTGALTPLAVAYGIAKEDGFIQ